MRVTTWLLVLALCAHAEQFSGKVVGVSDGDTITVFRDKVPTRVRLAGIEAPESGQAFGQRAKQAASRLAFGRTVTVIVRGEDRYSRTLGTVLLPDGSILNELLVVEGWAWGYRQYSNDARLREMEAAARRDRRGLWADPNPVPPWEFRARRRQPALVP